MPKPSNYELRQRLVRIAELEIGTLEIPAKSNTGPRIVQYQRATNYAGTRWFYCAAFTCWCIREWGKDPEVREALRLTPAGFELWRPQTPAAFGFHRWAEERGLRMHNDNAHPGEAHLRAGMIVTFDFSHIGILKTDATSTIYTIEGNTTQGQGGNDGGGVWNRTRPRKEANRFIEILPA